MKKILFLCVHNSARSQMAEGLAREMGRGKIEAFSAGLHVTGVNPHATHVMKEIGIDISGQRSKSVEEFMDEKFDFVITLCSEAEATCPIPPQADTVLHWPFLDPGHVDGTEEELLTAFRRVREGLKVKLQGLLTTV